MAMSLVDAAKQGDDLGLEGLLEPLLEPGYRLACGMLHDHQAAEDAVQEAALKAWRKLKQLRQGTEMRPWFLGIVANECRSTRRSRWWSVAKSLLPEAPTDVSADAVLTGMEVRRALRRLDEKKRLGRGRHWYLDLPVQEIAVATRSSVDGVESGLQRGTRDLRRRLEFRDE